MNIANNFLEKELSFKLIGIFINISKEHGCHFKENIYYNLLKEELKKADLSFIQFPKIRIYNRNDNGFLGYYYPDFLIENKIIVEIKASGQIHQTYIDQVTKYLSVSKYEIGFIVNFGTERAQIIRRVYSNCRKNLHQSSADNRE